jgi:hypothetical protein
LSIGRDITSRKPKVKPLRFSDELEPHREEETAEERKLESGTEKSKFPKELKSSSVPGEMPHESIIGEPNEMDKEQTGTVNANVVVNATAQRKHQKKE